jgi:hypothetical protein
LKGTQEEFRRGSRFMPDDATPWLQMDHVADVNTQALAKPSPDSTFIIDIPEIIHPRLQNTDFLAIARIVEDHYPGANHFESLRQMYAAMAHINQLDSPAPAGPHLASPTLPPHVVRHFDSLVSSSLVPRHGSHIWNLGRAAS